MTEVRAFAPGTVANVSCGFDIFGFALESPGDTVVARRRDEPGMGLRAIHGDGGILPLDPLKNTATVAAARLLDELNTDAGVELELHKGMPAASGLGSSAASSVAAVVATDALLEAKSGPELLLRCAVEGERAATGTPHADNAGPSLVGGFVMVRGPGHLPEFERVPVPEELFCAMLHPHVEVETRGARAVLPQSVPLPAAITQWSNAAALIVGLYESDYDLIGAAVQDVIAEPWRSAKIPGFAGVTAAAREAGAIAAGISGSGPSLFALTRGRETADRVAAAMKETFLAGGVADCTAWTSAVGAAGARVVDA